MRAFIEVAPDTFMDVRKLSPDHMVAAVDIVRDQLREVLGGLAPVLGHDVLLRVCREVLDEDK
jgi:hypothetical protein